MRRSRLAYEASESSSTRRVVAAKRKAIRGQSYPASPAALKRPPSRSVRQPRADGPPQVMHRLLDLPGDDHRVDDGVGTQVALAAVAPGGDVVGGHCERHQTGDGMDGALYVFLHATFAEGLDRHRLPVYLLR